MPELAEVDYYRRQWDPGLGQKISDALIHPKARIFRGIDGKQFVEALAGATLERSMAHGKQMLFVAKPKGKKLHAWLGVR